ncbi:MAG TPA: polysaccharide biosynthesis/export family protein [Candidatus Eisenbacteria bacterium]|nr:polysaccharide biosynthesis/export family protein [Candidatus Eisenbacteria bacterium]
MAGALLAVSVAPCKAAETAAPAPSGGSTPGTSNYRIGAGDVLNVEVVGRRDLSTQYTVGPDGVLFMPLTGGVTAEGKTVNELSAELARRLSLYDRDITQVNVSVAEFRSRKIFVLGAVVKPGKYSFAQLPNVWDAIGEAGGPAEDAQLSSVEVIPSDQTSGRASQIVDVAAAIREGRVQGLERLKPGDTVRVPKGLPGSGSALSATGNSVFMFGAITRPGPIPMERQMDLMAAIAQSGGPTPEANLNAVQIVRRNGPRTVHMKVNLNAFINKANSSGNPTLMAGDTVILPRQDSGGFLSVVRTLSPIVALASTIVILVRR